MMTTMTTWNPYNELERLQSRVMRAMNLDSARSNGSDDSLLLSSDWSPSVDITESEKEYEITADLPQLAKEDVKVVVENGSLVIKGERKRESEHTDKKVHRIERSYGTFYRSFSLPEDADGTGISAKFKDGVLRVLLPKNEEKLPKQIEVQVD
ncbi:MAG: Hsp20/alpha crystallin family protein [Akkermansiaceae bacterium]